MNLMKKRWIILAASCLVNLCIGSLYAWSVFSLPMANHLAALSGSAAPNLAIVFTVANAVGPITIIGGGFINDKLGPRWVILAGGLLFGAGMFFSGFAESVGMLLVTYGLGVGLGMGMVYGCTVSNSVKFFPDKRGLVGGIATASYGISSVVIPPIANMLIDTMSITNAFKVLGAVMAAIICICAFLIQACPPDFRPDGVTARAGNAQSPGKDWKGMLKDPAFYVMLIMLCCGAFSGLMVVSQASPLTQRTLGATPAAAAVMVSVIALFNTAGRLLAGFVSDKLGMVNTIRSVFVLSVAGLAVLGLCGSNDVLFYGGLCLVGLTFGAIMGIYPGFTAAQFGQKNNSVNYGIMFIGFAAAGYFGPTIMNLLYGATGSDTPAFWTAAGLSLLGLCLTWIFQVVSKQAHHK